MSNDTPPDGSDDVDDNDICGATTQGDDPCENPRTEEDGFCWIHSQHTETRNEGPSYEVQQRVCQNLRSVPVITHAVEATQDVSTTQHYHWMKIGKERMENGETENRYAEYAESVKRARAEGQLALLAQARQISTGDDPTPADASNLIKIYDRTVAGEARWDDDDPATDEEHAAEWFDDVEEAEQRALERFDGNGAGAGSGSDGGGAPDASAPGE